MSSTAVKLKESATEAFRGGDYALAMKLYTQAIALSELDSRETAACYACVASGNTERI